MILHVDMDAFFASIEQRDNPGLKGKPLVVGGNSKRSVVAAASYEARRYGIRSAMPMYQALEKCRDLIIVPVDKTKYRSVSKQVLEIFERFTPVVEQMSIDEAFLDVSGCERMHGDLKTIAVSIKNTIFQELMLTCSVGAAPVRFLAKIASDQNKPNGITIIAPEDALSFARDLDIHRVPGVGRQVLKQMELLNIRKLGDITRHNETILVKKFGQYAKTLMNFAQGIDTTPVGGDEKRKSISSESTLFEDTSDLTVIRKHMLSHAQAVGKELRKKNLFAANVVIKIKFADFTQVTRQKKLAFASCSSSILYENALLLVQPSLIQKKIRLIGLGVSSLLDSKRPVQLDIFTCEKDVSNKWEKVDRAVDSITEKFGNNSLKRGTLTQ